MVAQKCWSQGKYLPIGGEEQVQKQKERSHPTHGTQYDNNDSSWYVFSDDYSVKCFLCLILCNPHSHYYSHFTQEEVTVRWDDVSCPRTQLESGRAGTWTQVCLTPGTMFSSSMAGGSWNRFRDHYSCRPSASCPVCSTGSVACPVTNWIRFPIRHSQHRPYLSCNCQLPFESSPLLSFPSNPSRMHQ